MSRPRTALLAALLSTALLTRPAAGDDPPEPDWKPDETPADADALPPGAFARLGSDRFKHPGLVAAVALSADGRVAASASDDCLSLWDTATGRELHRYRSFDRKDIRIAAGGNTLAAVNRTREMRLIAVATGRYQSVYAEGSGCYENVTVSQDGAVIAAVRHYDDPEAGDGEGRGRFAVDLWDGRRARRLRQLRVGTPEVLSVALSPDGKRLTELRDDDRIHLWDVESGRELRAFRTRLGGKAMVLSATGPAVAVVGREGETVVLDSEAGKELCRLGHDQAGGQPTALAPDGHLLAVGRFDTVRLIGVLGAREVRRLAEPGNRSFALAFSADGKTLVTGGVDGKLRIWDVASGRERLLVAGHARTVTALAFSHDGCSLASGDDFSPVCLWDLRSGLLKRNLAHPSGGHSQGHLVFSPDGSRLAVAAESGLVVWDLSTGRPVAQTKEEKRRDLDCLVLVRGGRSLVCAENRDLVWRSADTLRVERRLLSRAAGSARSAVSPAHGGTLAAAGGRGGEALICDEGGRQVARLRGQPRDEVLCVALSPDGSRLAVCTAGESVLWDLESRSALRRWTIAQGWGGVSATAFSADGRLLAVCDDEQGARVFETATGGEAGCFRGKKGYPGAVGFTPDGRTLATGESYGTILLWDLTGTRAGPKKAAPSAAELAGLWDDLLAQDAGRAFRAVWRLADAPAQAVPFLRDRLKPAEGVPMVRVRTLIADLDAPRFAERQAAFRELSEAAERAEPELRRAAGQAHSAQAGDALARLLKALESERLRPTGERLRQLRAAQALEYMRTPESRELLDNLAGGMPGLTLTREARAALERLPR